MRFLFSLLHVLGIVAVSVAATASEPRNVLLICVDDLRPELGCYGRSHIHSPNIDRLASRGRVFRRHFVQAPTCGASRFALLTGQYGPAKNSALFMRADRISSQPDTISPCMPTWFRERGFTTVSVGKVSHHPGGRGGRNWDDERQPEMPGAWDRHLMPCGTWRHPKGAMHGLANGEIRENAARMDVLQSVEGPDSIYPDGLIVEESLRQIDQLASEAEQNGRGFFLAVGLIRPHLPFGAPAKYMAPYADTSFPTIQHAGKPMGATTWHPSGEFMKYNRWGRDPNKDDEFALLVRRHYAACVSFADASVGRILQRLARVGLRESTVVVLWGDHGWHLGEHAIWGKHSLFEESLHSPLVIAYDGMPSPGVATTEIVESIDLFPTLCAIVGLELPSFAAGASRISLLQRPDSQHDDVANHDDFANCAVSYTGKARTIRTDQYRLIVHDNGHTELYDHGQSDAETRNIASENPQLVESLRKRLEEKLVTRVLAE